MIKYILIGITTIGLMVSCKDKPSEPTSFRVPPIEQTDEQNTYMGMRNLAFNITPEQIGFEDIANDKVFGLITEMDMDPGCASVIAYLNGETSIYVSSGGAYIGAGEYDDVRDLVKSKVNGFQKYVSKAKKIDEPKLPKDGKVIFNFLTKNGLYAVTENLAELESQKSELTILFIEVNEIITQIRLKSGE